MRAVHRRSALRFILSSTGVALLAACAPAAPQSAAPTAGAASAPTQGAASSAPAATGTETPRRSGTFVGVIASDPQAGNRDTNTDLSAFYAFSPLYSALVHTDASRQPLPDLADSWTISPE